MSEHTQQAPKGSGRRLESGKSSPQSCLLSDPESYAAGVPHSEFARLRRESPVAWIDGPPLRLHSSAGSTTARGSGYWAIIRHDLVASVSRQPKLFSSASRGAFFVDPKSHQDLERTRQLLINMDAPQHSTIRRLITDAFTPLAIRHLQDNIRRHAQSIVDRVLGQEQFDAVRDLAAELPIVVLADLLGMPSQDRGLIYKWSNNIVGFDDPEYGGGNIEAYQQTFVETFEYAREIAAAKRRQPGDDLISQLVKSDIEGRRLTETEFCHLWLLLVIGGNESTRHLISGSLQALNEWPDERHRLIANPDLIPTAVEELLRWVTPVMQFRRTAIQDTEINGQKINEGDKVVLYYISANRDEKVFESADQLNLTRTPNPHLAFGIGPHFCLGAHLARLEAATLLKALLPHLTKFQITGPVKRLKSNFMNGIKSMPSRFAPASIHSQS